MSSAHVGMEGASCCCCCCIYIDMKGTKGGQERRATELSLGRRIGIHLHDPPSRPWCFGCCWPSHLFMSFLKRWRFNGDLMSTRSPSVHHAFIWNLRRRRGTTRPISRIKRILRYTRAISSTIWWDVMQQCNIPQAGVNITNLHKDTRETRYQAHLEIRLIGYIKAYIIYLSFEKRERKASAHYIIARMHR